MADDSDLDFFEELELNNKDIIYGPVDPKKITSHINVGVYNPHIYLPFKNGDKIDPNQCLPANDFKNDDLGKSPIQASNKKNKNSFPKYDDITNNIKTGAVGSSDPSDHDDPANYNTCNSAVFIVNQYKNKNDIITDVVQGACLDCYFMVALYSTVWTYYPNFPVPQNPDSNGNYTINFFVYPPGPGQSPGQKAPQQISGKLPLDQNSHTVFAQETRDFEIWACLYEKAYAKFIGLSSSNLPGASKTDPEIGSFPQGDPILSLTHITKMLWDFGNPSINTNTTGVPSAFYTGSSLFNKYGGGSYNILSKYNSIFNGYSARTQFPTVAWTRPTDAKCPGMYNNNALWQSHSYSILGTYADTTGNYIVLYNPWERTVNAGDSSLSKLKLALGNWQADSTFGMNLTGVTNGIFGLETSLFDTCFEGFGWVRFAMC